MRKILLTSKNCSPCKVVKDYVDESYEVYDIDEEVGRSYLEDFGVRAVPALIVDQEVYTGVKPILERIKLG